MALDLTPEQKTTGKANFQRVVGKLGTMDRRRFMQGLLAGGAALPIAAAAYFGYNNTAFRERPVKAGLIGAGDEGGVLIGEHNPAYLQFIAYSDIRPYNKRRIFDGEPTGPRKGFKHHYGANAERDIRWYENYRDLLANPDIEMVVIALPLNLHKEATIAALEAGKHVLCEKLMGWNVQQCRDMVRAAHRADRLLAIGHQRHYSMLYAHAVEVVNSGQMGDIQHIRALWHRNSTGVPEEETVNGRRMIRYSRDSWRRRFEAVDQAALTGDLSRYGWKDLYELVRWRLFRHTGGGLMAELGSHQLDACSIFLGKKHPLAVTAYGGKNFYQDDREIEDHVYCTYEFPGKHYDPAISPRDADKKPVYNDVCTVTYSSINTNNFENYGECVMGTKGTMIVEAEQNVYLYGADGRSTSVTASSGGISAVDTSGSGPPAVDRAAAETGAASLGHAPPSRGYREEMEHLAYCIRMRGEGMARDRADLKPRCDGQAAMADAILALAANAAMRTGQRIEFRDDWFRVNLDNPTDNPNIPWDLPEPTRAR
ncbi:MAG: Gfo/Idh/MocA family oxidoreductase [Gemmataceae bacterium]